MTQAIYAPSPADKRQKEAIKRAIGKTTKDFFEMWVKKVYPDDESKSIDRVPSKVST